MFPEAFPLPVYLSSALSERKREREKERERERERDCFDRGGKRAANLSYLFDVKIPRFIRSSRLNFS